MLKQHGREGVRSQELSVRWPTSFCSKFIDGKYIVVWGPPPLWCIVVSAPLKTSFGYIITPILIMYLYKPFKVILRKTKPWWVVGAIENFKRKSGGLKINYLDYFYYYFYVNMVAFPQKSSNIFSGWVLSVLAT